MPEATTQETTTTRTTGTEESERLDNGNNLKSINKTTSRTKVTVDGELEGRLALVQDVILFIKENFQPVLNTLLIISVGIFIYVGFRVMQAQIDRLSIVANTIDGNTDSGVTPVSPADIETRFKVDEAINGSLIRLITNAESARAFLFQFHNGEHSVGKVSFLYASETHEAVRAGVSRDLTTNQRIPSSLGYKQGNEMLNNGYYCSTRDEMGADAYADFLRQRGVVAICMVPILNSDGEMVAFIGVDFVNIDNWPEDRSSLVALINRHAAEIEGILHTIEQDGKVNLYSE